MQLLEKFDQITAVDADQPSEKVLSHKLSEELKGLTVFSTFKDMQKSSLYAALKDEIETITHGYEFGCYADVHQKFSKPYCRAILWHLENGMNYRGILETLRNRALVSQADIYFFPAVDIGRARSDNRNVIRDLAIELGYNYYFTTTYLNLPGTNDSDIADTQGIEGNAIMTRLPLSNLRVISLKREPDSFLFGTKRLGCEKAVVADLNFDGKKFTVICLNLPTWSSPRQRARYVKQVLSLFSKSKEMKETQNTKPVLLAGDLKTSNYNCASGAAFVLSLINKAYRDFDYIIQEHHTFPEKHFDRHVFEAFAHHKFDFMTLNEIGKGTLHATPDTLFTSTQKPAVVERLIQKILARYREKLPFKYDWFAANELIRVSQSHQAERPKVISHLFLDGKPVSSHDPILLDFEIFEDENAAKEIVRELKN